MVDVKERRPQGRVEAGSAAKVEPSYETDFSEWSFRQAELVRLGQFSSLDMENVVEELESMGNEQRRGLMSAYRLLILHLLKWRHQPDRRTRSWTVTIDRERANIDFREQTNKTLAKKADELVADIYKRACRSAAVETGLPLKSFPETCPFTLAQLRDDEFLPA